MTLSIDDVVFKVRALAQTHPFTPRAQAYLNATVSRERLEQPVPEIGIWAGYAIGNGYCLRRVEEQDSGRQIPANALAGQSVTARADDVDGMDEFVSALASQIPNEQAGEFLLYPESVVVDALDRLIGGEVERRLSHWAETIDQETFAELEEYITWWTLKGYALRVAEQLVGVEDR